MKVPLCVSADQMGKELFCLVVGIFKDCNLCIAVFPLSIDIVPDGDYSCRETNHNSVSW